MRWLCAALLVSVALTGCEFPVDEGVACQPDLFLTKIHAGEGESFVLEGQVAAGADRLTDAKITVVMTTTIIQEGTGAEIEGERTFRAPVARDGTFTVDLRDDRFDGVEIKSVTLHSGGCHGHWSGNDGTQVVEAAGERFTLPGAIRYEEPPRPVTEDCALSLGVAFAEVEKGDTGWSVRIIAPVDGTEGLGDQENTAFAGGQWVGPGGDRQLTGDASGGTVIIETSETAPGAYSFHLDAFESLHCQTTQPDQTLTVDLRCAVGVASVEGSYAQDKEGYMLAFEVVVVDQDGNPAPGTEVSAQLALPQSREGESLRGTTDENGRVTLQHHVYEPGRYRLTVHSLVKDGYVHDAALDKDNSQTVNIPG